jgi:hypothetical protein
MGIVVNMTSFFHIDGYGCVERWGFLFASGAKVKSALESLFGTMCRQFPVLRDHQ